MSICFYGKENENFEKIVKHWNSKTALRKGIGSIGERGYQELKAEQYLNDMSEHLFKIPFNSDFEFTKGSIGFARSTEFDSEDSEFFITLKEIPIYQGEYTPIGKVRFGLDILKKIKTGNKAIYVLRPDYINTFRMLETN